MRSGKQIGLRRSVLIIGLFFILGVVTFAQGGIKTTRDSYSNNYILTEYSFDGGSISSTSSNFDMHGTVGGIVSNAISSNNFSVTSGFDANYQVASPLYSISGYIKTSTGTGVPNVVISSSTGDSSITNADGFYEFSSLANGTYMLTPVQSGYSFVPNSLLLSVPPNQLNQNFTAVITTISAFELVVKSGYLNIKLDWQPYTDTLALNHYQVQRSTDNGLTFQSVANVSDLFYTDTNGLTQNANYCYQIAAIDVNNHTLATSNIECVVYGHLELWIPETRALPGVDVTVPVNISNADGLRIASSDIWLDYNGDLIRPKNISNTPLTAQYNWQYAADEAGVNSRLRIAAYSSPGEEPILYDGGTLFRLTFETLGLNEQNTLLDLKEFIPGIGGSEIYDPRDEFTPIPLDLRDGTLYVEANTAQNVVAYILGDLNGNSVVQAIDARIALGIASGQTIPTDIQRASGDVNGNSVIDAGDASMILYYAVHLEWPLPPSTPRIYQQHQTTLTYQINADSAPPSSISHINIVANATSDWAGGELIIAYPVDLVDEITNITPATSISSCQFAAHDNGNGLLKIAFAGCDGLSSDGAIVTMDAHIRADAQAGQSGDLTLVDARAHDFSGRDFARSELQYTVNRVNSVLVIVDQFKVYLPMVTK